MDPCPHDDAIGAASDIRGRRIRPDWCRAGAALWGRDGSTARHL